MHNIILAAAVCGVASASPLAKREWGSWQAPSNASHASSNTTVNATASSTSLYSSPSASVASWGAWSAPSSSSQSSGSSTTGEAPWSSPLSYAPAPIHTLTPSIPPGHNSWDLGHLQPQSSQGLFFAQGDSNSTFSMADCKHLANMISSSSLARLDVSLCEH